MHTSKEDARRSELKFSQAVVLLFSVLQTSCCLKYRSKDGVATVFDRWTVALVSSAHHFTNSIHSVILTFTARYSEAETRDEKITTVALER